MKFVKSGVYQDFDFQRTAGLGKGSITALPLTDIDGFLPTCRLEEVFFSEFTPDANNDRVYYRLSWSTLNIKKHSRSFSGGNCYFLLVLSWETAIHLS